ncbi:RNA 2',3'-cyclic phosphodiesterase [Exiguobacterium flavidum]|uniref:RNA 2',3'-cyclic phosphodiesterase n=1 Tax=Exiguobacterium flavidum TaxID=2184695 RepID=UPI000DF7ACC0|nr:RNA 2',3'-cyclic phosphodiesterase [Exiguobacterium flavidum]
MGRHYFIALPMHDDRIAETVKAIPLTAHYKNVYGTEDYHLTLRFLGEVGEEELANWKVRIKMVAEEFVPFKIELSETVLFGVKERPRVFAFGPKVNEELNRIALPFQEEGRRGFVPHVTLAKKWRQGAGPLVELAPFSIPVAIEEIILYEIRPGETPRYVKRLRCPLGRVEETR